MDEGIEFHGVSFSYAQDMPVLHDLDFSIEKGAFIGIFGPNGAGKSTLLKLAAGILRPQAGRVLVGGMPMHDIPRYQAARLAAYVPPVLVTPFPYTVFEFASMAYVDRPGWSGLDAKAKADIMEALRMVDMDAMHERTVSNLSSGEQKLVLLARAIVQGASTLLLDEPLANLDMNHALQVMQTLAQLRQNRNLTVVCVSHEVNIPLQFVHTVMLLNQRVVALGPAEDVMMYPTLKQTFDTEIYIGRNELNNRLFIVPMNRQG